MENIVTRESYSTRGDDTFNFEKYFSTLSTEILGKSIVYHDSISSTHDLIENYIKLNGLVVVAGEQTKGRGRTGNVWHSPRGCAMFSFVQHVKLSSFLGQRLSLIQILISMAVVRGINKLVGHNLNLRLKWPNDIYYGREKKIGGVIVNSSVDGDAVVCRIGCGVNVDNDYPTEGVNKILKKLLPEKALVCVEEVIAETLNDMEKLCKALEKPSGFNDFEKSYKNLWLHTDQHIKTADSIEVKIVGINDYGFLLVEDVQTKQILTATPDGNRFDMLQNVLTQRVE